MFPCEIRDSKFEIPSLVSVFHSRAATGSARALGCCAKNVKPAGTSTNSEPWYSEPPLTADRTCFNKFYWLPSFSLTGDRGEILAKSAMSIIPGPENSQPSLLALNDGRTLAYLRNPRGGSLLLSKFDANTKEWSAAKPLNLPSPDSPADVIECQSGVLVVYTSDQKRRVSMSLAWAARR
jgi:BNR repeat-like domain